MSTSRRISDGQLAILKWIGDGCQQDVVTGHVYKTTANSLQNRGLVVISRKGGIWRASITEKGLAYLEHGPGLMPPNISSEQSPALPPVEHGHDSLTTEPYGGRDYLVVATDFGGSAHLVAPLVEGMRDWRRRAKAAVPTFGLHLVEYVRHDLDLLSEKRWSGTTVCDRRWSGMLSDKQQQHFERHDFDLFRFSPRATWELSRDIRCSRCWSWVR